MIKTYFDCNKMLPKNIQTNKKYESSKVYEEIFRLAWPSAIESITLALMSAADMIMVSQVGANAIASVGISNYPKFLLFVPITAITVSTSVLIARRKGENNQEVANTILKTAIMMTFIVGIILSCIGILFSNELLLFSGANQDYLKMANEYFDIIQIGNIFGGVALAISAAQRGSGNTKVSLRINLVANIVNISCNFLLINGLFFFPKLGVNGAAIATAIGNFVSMGIGLLSLVSSEKFLSFSKGHLCTMKAIKSILKLASSVIVEQLCLRMGFLLFSKSVAMLGTISLAAHQIVVNCMNFSFALGDGLSVATSSLVGQKLGAKQPDDAIVYGKSSQRLGHVIGIIACLAVIVMRLQILQLFTHDALILSQAAIPVLILPFCILFQISQVITVGSLRGAGDVKFVAKMMMFSVAVVRPGMSFLLTSVFQFGLPGAWIAILLDQSLRNLISFIRFKQAKWVYLNV